MNMPETKKRSYKRTMIPVIRIVNPFNPREFVRDEMAWARKKTLAEYFPLGTAEQSVVSINGKIIPQEQFGATYIAKGDNVVVCPIPAGGGGGKQILSMVAMIAVAVYAPVLAGSINGALGLSTAAGSFAMAATTAGVMMAGSMLVNTVFAPPQPKAPSAEATSSSYGIDGAKNTSLEGIPVPVCYGEFRMGGNILGLYTLNDGDTQILYMLLSAGEGPIAGISDILINDNPIADYKDVETEIRLGTPDQTAIDWFNETTVAQNKGTKLTTDWTYHTTTTPIDKFRLDVVAPSGLCEIDTKSGASKNRSVTLEIQYRPIGSADWNDIQSQTIEGWRTVRADGSGVDIVWKYEDGTTVTDQAQLEYLDKQDYGKLGSLVTAAAVKAQERTPIYSDTLTITSNKRSAVRKSFASGKLNTDKYEIRVRRTTAKSTEGNVLDELYLSDVNEIQTESLTYPNTALLALKIKLGDQISGLPTVTYVNGGRILGVYGKPTGAGSDQWYQAASKNPAWIVWDILTNRRFGGAMQTSRLDFPAFQRWAKHCDEQGFTWDGVIDTEMNVWDACQLVLRCGRAQLVPIGTRYTVVVEKKADPVMMFSVANMVEGSYKETWLPVTDRANEIDVTFYDRTDNYKERTIKVYDPAALVSCQKQKTSAITLQGVVDFDRAYKEGQFQLNLNRYVLKTASFQAPMEAIGCTVGDVILLQSDMTEWATAGRFEAGSTTSVMKLDRPVTMIAGKTYKLLLLRDSVERYAGAVTNVVGNSVFLSGFDGMKTVKRLQVNGMDLAVTDTFNQGGGQFGVIVDNPAGITVNAGYKLIDTDVIEDYDVVTTAGTTTSVTLRYPTAQAPSQFSQWMFGESAKVKKPFRVKSIGGSEYTRDIEAVEYNEAVYDYTRFSDTAPIPQVTGDIGAARDLSAYEETYIAGEGVATSVYATWRSPASGIYGGADVYVQKNDGQLVKYAEVQSATSCRVTELMKGDVVRVKVVAFDMFGKRSSFDQAPEYTYTVVGVVPGIEVGGVTGTGYQWNGRDCKLTWRYNAVTHSYEFGSEPVGADAGALDPQFKDYEIRVYNHDHKTLRRTEYTTDNSYTYTYDKNYADGVARHLIFEIRMRDRFNNLGAPSILDAYNAPPEVSQVSVAATFESAIITYQHSADPDFAGVQVFISEFASDLNDITNVKGQGRLVYEGPDSSIVVPSLMFNQTYYYRVVPFDAFGKTELVPTAVLSFKTSYFNVDTIKDEMLEVGKFAKTIDPVGIVDALPDPTTWERPVVVFLTTDSKMYRLSGGKWVSTIPAADVTGQLVSQQIADAAINTAKFAQGISPIGVVDELPAVSGYKGPTVVMLSTDGKLYRLSGGKWTSAVPAADVTGQLTNAQLADIAATKIAGQLTDAQLAAISAAKITGQLTDAQLSQISAAKVAGQLTDAQISAISAAKLTGTVTAAQIADAAISTAKFAQGIQPVSVVNALPAVSGYTGPSVVFLTTDGKIYRMSGGAWTSAVPATDLTGQITSTQITDNAITTAKITAGAITTGKLAAGAVTANEIAADTITSGNIAAGAITASEIASGAVTTAKLSAGAVTANELAAGSVTTAKLTAGAVTANELAANSVTANAINTGAVTTAKLAAGAVTADTIAANAVTAAAINAGAVTTAKLAAGAVTSDTIAANAVTAAAISAGAVTAGKIAAGAVTANELAANAVTAGKISAGAVTAGTIAANAVTASEIAANSITTAKIAAGAVSATEIAAGAITTSKLAAGAVTATELAAGAVTAAKISAGAITSDKLAANSVTAGTIAAGAVSASQIAAGAVSADKLAAGQIITTSAQIADGIIVSAKIGNAEVSTLKIAGQAVTIPVSAYSEWGYACGGGANDVQSCGISSSGAPILVTFGAKVLPAQTDKIDNEGRVYTVYNSWSMSLLRDGIQIFSMAGPTDPRNYEGVAGCAGFSISDTPGAGWHVYTLRVTMSGGYSGSAQNRIITLLETKR